MIISSKSAVHGQKSNLFEGSWSKAIYKIDMIMFENRQFFVRQYSVTKKEQNNTIKSRSKLFEGKTKILFATGNYFLYILFSL